MNKCSHSKVHATADPDEVFCLLCFTTVIRPEAILESNSLRQPGPLRGPNLAREKALVYRWH